MAVSINVSPMGDYVTVVIDNHHVPTSIKEDTVMLIRFDSFDGGTSRGEKLAEFTADSSGYVSGTYVDYTVPLNKDVRYELSAGGAPGFATKTVKVESEACAVCAKDVGSFAVRYNPSLSGSVELDVELYEYEGIDLPVSYTMRGTKDKVSASCTVLTREEYAKLIEIAKSGKAYWKDLFGNVSKCAVQSISAKRSRLAFAEVSFDLYVLGVGRGDEAWV